ncbi:MAG: YbgC/FadM family acyl-CoA thioesterase [bacterium]|nr:YbgC/FadM family acyl-CoA thioesterase [bacterium]
MVQKRSNTVKIPYRVAYQDTDAGGVVYYANYLGFMERGRNEYLRQLGRSIKDYQDSGIFFVVVEAALRYRAPAVLDDLLTIETWIEEGRRSSAVFGQRVLREGDGTLLVKGDIRVACINDRLRPTRLPPELLPGRGGEPRLAD